MSFRFTIITAVYNSEKYLAESIESVISQDFGFKDNVQLILVDDGSTDRSRDIALEYQKDYPENILVLSKENGGVASARNLGLEHVKGEFVNFLDSDDKFPRNALTVIDNFLKENPDINVVSMPLKFFDKREGDHYLNYKFDSEGIIDLNETIDYPQLHISSSFVRYEVLKDYRFNTGLVNGSDAELLTRVLVDVGEYGVVNQTHYNYRKRQDESSIMDNARKSKRFFTEKMKIYYEGLIDYSISKKGSVPRFLQYSILLDMAGIIKSDNYDGIFDSDEEIKEFWKVLNNILSYIDEDIIVNHRYLKHDLMLFIVFLKFRDFHSELVPKKHKVRLIAHDRVVSRLHNHKLRFDYMDVDDDNIIFYGLFASNCHHEALTMQAVKNDEVYNGVLIDPPTEGRKTKSYLGIGWKYHYNFKLEVPIKGHEFEVSFKIRYCDDGENSVDLLPEIDFKQNCNMSLLNNEIKFESTDILFENNRFYIKNDNLLDSIKHKLKI